MTETRGTWVIVLSLIVALVMYVAPIPTEWRWFRPELPMLVLFYWVLALPHRVGVISAASVGFALDIMDGTAVGALAVGMVLSVVFLLFSYQRIRQFDTFQQSVVIALVTALALVIERWLQTLVGIGSSELRFLYPIPLTAVCWPFVRTVLRSLRRYYEVM